MRATIILLIASVATCRSLDARRHRDCASTETTTVTVTVPQSIATKTVTVTAKSNTTTSTTATTTLKIVDQKSTATSVTTTSISKSSTQKPTTIATTTTTTATTTKASTKPTTTTSKTVTPTKQTIQKPEPTSCEEIGDGNTRTAANGKKWHVQCGQRYTGSNSIIGYSDSVDNLAECLDYCSTVSGARVVQYMESDCECWANGGTGISSLEDADAAYTLPDNS